MHSWAGMMPAEPSLNLTYLLTTLQAERRNEARTEATATARARRSR